MTRRAEADHRPIYEELSAQARREIAAGQAICARLMAAMPGWLVLWGAGSREYTAYPLRHPAPMQRSTDASDLAEQMLAVEMAAAPAGRWSPANPPAAPAAASGRPEHQNRNS